MFCVIEEIDTLIVFWARAVEGVNHVVTRGVIVAGLIETVVDHVTNFT